MRDLLHAADHAYYSCLPPLMTDAEYDHAARLCGHVSAFATAELPSLENAICGDELLDWIDRVPSGERYFYLEVKADGVSVLARYENGRATGLRSRKLDLSPLAQLLPEVPGLTGTVTGELWHPDGRNVASGRIRARDTSAGLRFMPFCTDSPMRDLFASRGFEVSPWSATTTENADILTAWRKHQRGHICPELPSDGLVLKCALPGTRSKLGRTKRSPVWALALK